MDARPQLAIFLVAVCAACAIDEDTHHGGDGAPVDAGRGDAGDCSAPPEPRPPWLAELQADVIVRLSGAAEIEPGLTLADRASGTSRDAVRAFLSDRLADLGYEPLIDDYGGGANVYAELPATHGGTETIVVGAHFDSVPDSPGANDNATGVAMVMAAARHLRDMSCRRRTVVFVLFDQEEVGLVGSQNFAQLLLAAQTRVISVHTIDQNGWDQDGDRAVELERPSGDLAVRYQGARDGAGLSMPLQVTQTGATDHVSFRAAGFAAVGVTEEFAGGDTTPHYHLPGDVYPTVDLGYLASTTALLHAVLAEELAVDNAAARLEPWSQRSLAEVPRPPAVEVTGLQAGCRSGYR